jgi:sugar-specific transcriptional regulator TrmB
MDDKFLCQLGFSENQARAYRALITKKGLKPGQLAKLIGESRANCYAILNKLVELGIARKVDENNKLTYYPESPLAIEALIAKRVANEQTRLASLQSRLPQMLTAFSADGERPKIETFEGKNELSVMYELQAEKGAGTIHFIHSRKDIPYFGAAKMRKLRYLAVNKNVYRHAISPFVKAFYNPIKDRTVKLRRTWIEQSDYDSPVEWSVRDDTLHILLFKEKGYGVSIKNREIAESFRQLHGLIDKNVRHQPDYKNRYPSRIKVDSKYKKLEERTNRELSLYKKP